MLAANGHKLYFYSHYNEEKHRNDMEIDFIISNNSKLKYKMFPIEVKSGNVMYFENGYHKFLENSSQFNIIVNRRNLTKGLRRKCLKN